MKTSSSSRPSLAQPATPDRAASPSPSRRESAEQHSQAGALRGAREASIRSPAREPSGGAAPTPITRRHAEVGAGRAPVTKVIATWLDRAVREDLEPRAVAIQVADAVGAYEALPAQADLAALSRTIAVRAGELPLPCLVALGEVLASVTPAAAASVPAVLEALAQDLLGPLARGGSVDAAAALLLGLRRACQPRHRIQPAPPAELAQAAKGLRAWVSSVHEPCAPQRHAMLVCALELGGPRATPSPLPPPLSLAPPAPRTRRVLASGPDTLGRLLAQDPLRVLEVGSLQNVAKLSLVTSGLRLMAAHDPARLQAAYQRIAAAGPRPGDLHGLLALLRQGRESLGPGCWRARALAPQAFEAVLGELLSVVARLWSAQGDRIAGEVAEQTRVERARMLQAREIDVRVETKAGADADPAFTEALERAEAGAQAWAAQEASRVLQEALSDLVDFVAGFEEAAWLRDGARTPTPAQRAFVSGLGDWLRESAAGHRASKDASRMVVALMADELAGALDAVEPPADRSA